MADAVFEIELKGPVDLALFDPNVAHDEIDEDPPSAEDYGRGYRDGLEYCMNDRAVLAQELRDGMHNMRLSSPGREAATLTAAAERVIAKLDRLPA